MTSTMGQDLANIYGRELDRLADEITAYENDTDLWTTMGAQKNPPGSLALHTVGALMHFISGALGGSGYVRDRDREFSERDVPRARSCVEFVTAATPSSRSSMGWETPCWAALIRALCQPTCRESRPEPSSCTFFGTSDGTSAMYTTIASGSPSRGRSRRGASLVTNRWPGRRSISCCRTNSGQRRAVPSA